MQSNSLSSYESTTAEVVAEIEQEYPGLASGPQRDRAYLISHFLDRKDTKAQSLKAALNADASFGLLRAIRDILPWN